MRTDCKSVRTGVNRPNGANGGNRTNEKSVRTGQMQDSKGACPLVITIAKFIHNGASPIAN